MTGRRAELRSALERTEARVRAACEASGRNRDEVTVIAVTKFFPPEDIEILVDLGVTDIGESRDQEAATKVAALAQRLAGHPPRVHFVGQLQRNKAGSVAGYADVVHSVDRARLAAALDTGAARAGRLLDVLVQVDLDVDPDPGRGGVAPAGVRELAQQLEAYPCLRLAGVMAVAPLGQDPTAAFGRLREVHEGMLSAYPDAVMRPAGMSADLEEAVAAGATHLRVGTAILGSRPSHR